MMAGSRVVSISLDDESLAILDTVMYDFQTTNKSEAVTCKNYTPPDFTRVINQNLTNSQSWIESLLHES